MKSRNTDTVQYFTRERVTRFTKALRSGMYRRNFGSLVNQASEDDSFCYCALGVLCKVEGFEESSIIGREEVRTRWGFISPKREFVYSHAVPDELFIDSGGWFERRLSIPLEYGTIKYWYITSANDHGVPWSVIADYIDKHYPCSDEHPKEVA